MYLHKLKSSMYLQNLQKRLHVMVHFYQIFQYLNIVITDDREHAF